MTNPMDMTGRRVLVVGASSGIGRAAAILLSQLGARVILVARHADKLDLVLRELEGEGHQAEVFDVSRYDAIPEWLRGVSGKAGPLDGAVNCAGKFTMSPLKVIDAKQAEALWKVNVFSHLWLAKGFRQRGVVAAAGGSIVLISSVVGLIGQAGLSMYSASKGAIVSMTRSLAMELAREKIRVNCVAPSNLKTAMTDVSGPMPTPEEYMDIEKEHPLGFGEPGDVANAIVYLLSPAAKWITGTTLVLDGGYTAH